jgi:hypothetical protein
LCTACVAMCMHKHICYHLLFTTPLVGDMLN